MGECSWSCFLESKMPSWGGVIPTLRSVWRERRSAGFHPEGHSHHQQTVCETLFNWKKVLCPTCTVLFCFSSELYLTLAFTDTNTREGVHDASSYYISSFSFFQAVGTSVWPFLPEWGFCVRMLRINVCVCVSGSVKCNQWTGPPSLASWYGSVRVPVGWGRDPGVICSPATAMAASKCGTWLPRWTPLTKERRGRKRVRKKRQMEERQRGLERQRDVWRAALCIH